MFAFRYSKMLIKVSLVMILFIFNFQFNDGTNLQGHNCAKDEFQCILSKKCIPLEQRCDGEFADCNVEKPIKITDLSDETDCPCNELTQYTCDDGSCIPVAKRCDGIPNCKDISDEFLCDYSAFYEKNKQNSKNSSSLTQSFLADDINNHLDEAPNKVDVNSTVTDEIWLQKHDESFTTFPEIGASENSNRVKKNSETSGDNATRQFTNEENQQESQKKSEGGNSCSDDQTLELRVFFASMCEGVIKLSKKRQLRAKKVIFDIVLEMENEEEKDSRFNQIPVSQSPLVTNNLTYAASIMVTPRHWPLHPAINSATKKENAVFFPATGGYLMAFDHFIVGEDLEIELEIQPRNADGILVAVHSGNHFFILQLINGSVKLTANNGNGPFHAIFMPREQNYLRNNRWHTIKAVKAKVMTILLVDGQGTDFGIDPAGSQFTKTNHSLYIGGCPPDLFHAKGIETQTQYVGCMRNLKINQINCDLASFNAFENVITDGCPVF